MNEEDITLQQEIRIIHHKLDYLLEVVFHLHNVTRHVAVGKTKGSSFEKSKQAVKDERKRLKRNMKKVLSGDDQRTLQQNKV